MTRDAYMVRRWLGDYLTNAQRCMQSLPSHLPVPRIPVPRIPVPRVRLPPLVRIPHELYGREKKLRGTQKAKRAGHRCPARFAVQDPP